MSKLKEPYKECVDCKWNNFPECKGTKMSKTNQLMSIEYLRNGFQEKWV